MHYTCDTNSYIYIHKPNNIPLRVETAAIYTFLSFHKCMVVSVIGIQLHLSGVHMYHRPHSPWCILIPLLFCSDVYPHYPPSIFALSFNLYGLHISFHYISCHRVNTPMLDIFTVSRYWYTILLSVSLARRLCASLFFILFLFPYSHRLTDIIVFNTKGVV